MVKGLDKFKMKEMYINGFTLKKISEIMDCDVSNVRAHLKRMNVPRRTLDIAGVKYPMNRNYFSKINTEAKAYILGLLYADGYNQEDRNCVSLRLHDKDFDIMEKIKEEMEITKPIKSFNSKHRMLAIELTSKKISKDLAKVGMTKAKTFIVRFPYDHLDKSLYRHFIRGYFDGDGCANNTNPKFPQCQFTGNLDFMSDLRDVLINDNSNLNFVKIHPHFKSGTLRYGGRGNCIKMMNYLYKDATIYFDRKYSIFREIARFNGNIRSKRLLIAGKP